MYLAAYFWIDPITKQWTVLHPLQPCQGIFSLLRWFVRNAVTSSDSSRADCANECLKATSPARSCEYRAKRFCQVNISSNEPGVRTGAAWYSIRGRPGGAGHGELCISPLVYCKVSRSFPNILCDDSSLKREGMQLRSDWEMSGETNVLLPMTGCDLELSDKGGKKGMA